MNGPVTRRLTLGSLRPGLVAEVLPYMHALATRLGVTYDIVIPGPRWLDVEFVGEAGPVDVVHACVSDHVRLLRRIELAA